MLNTYLSVLSETNQNWMTDTSNFIIHTFNIQGDADFAELDDCGVCSGGNSGHVANSDKDCYGDCFGSALLDDCNVCSGGNTGHDANSDKDECGECFGDGVLDCNGDCDGTASLDDCGVCSGGNSGHVANSDIDCHGDCFGTALVDDCGVCADSNTGLVADADKDCAGVCNGLSELDECGLCEGGNECYEFELTFADGTIFAYDLHVEDGMHIDDYFGETSYDWEVESGIITLADGTKINVTSQGPSRDHGAGHILWDGFMITSETYDSNGNSYAFDIVPDSSDDMFDFMSNGGTASFSTAVYYGEINGNSSAVAVLDFATDCFVVGPDADCFGDCFGTASLDDCGVCSGGNSGHDANSDKDECGVCFGDGVDTDDDGVCDDVDECVGDYDPCGICNGDGTWCLTETSITLGAATTTSLEVLYDSPLNIGGFQFNISGANVTAGSGGAAGNGFQVSAGGSTVLGFAFDGSVIPSGSGVLTNLSITATDFSGCISDIVLSDDDGDQFGTENENCVDLPCPADADGDNVCDHSDPCVGIYDCNGACADISYLSWVGDGFCDATGYGDNTPGYGLNFMCEEYNFDLGDCDS